MHVSMLLMGLVLVVALMVFITQAEEKHQSLRYVLGYLGFAAGAIWSAYWLIPGMYWGPEGARVADYFVSVPLVIALLSAWGAMIGYFIGYILERLLVKTNSLVKSVFRSLLGIKGSRGQGLAEYALILALIAVIAIAALVFLGTQISHLLSRIGANS